MPGPTRRGGHPRRRGAGSRSASRHGCLTWGGRTPAGAATAESFASFRQAVASIDDRVLADHPRRRDLSRWVLDVFANETLGVQLRKLEARWERGEVPDLRRELERLIAFRYDTEP